MYAPDLWCPCRFRNDDNPVVLALTGSTFLLIALIGVVYLVRTAPPLRRRWRPRLVGADTDLPAKNEWICNIPGGDEPA